MGIKIIPVYPTRIIINAKLFEVILNKMNQLNCQIKVTKHRNANERISSCSLLLEKQNKPKNKKSIAVNNGRIEYELILFEDSFQ